MAPRSRPDPRPLDRAALEAAALAYLERYSSSAENLRRVLLRKIRRNAARGAETGDDLASVVDDIVQRYAGARLVDDEAYARGRAASLHRRGESSRAIRAKLGAKGVADADVRQALAALADERSPEEVELAAAWRLAQKRRWGPFRGDEAARVEHRERDLAALVRRGFSYAVANRVIRARPDEAPALRNSF